MSLFLVQSSADGDDKEFYDVEAHEEIDALISLRKSIHYMPLIFHVG